MRADTARAGSLISAEAGCYSDYSVVGFFVVLRDFNPAAELEKYLTEHPEQRGDYQFKDAKWLATLLASGYLLEITHGVLHLGDYSRASEVEFTPIRTVVDD